MKALVADSNPLVREILTKAVQVLGWELQVFQDGAGVAQYLNELQEPCVALVGSDLAGVTGIDLVKRFSGRDPDRAVFNLFVTLRCDARTQVEALAAGAVDVLVLPMETDVIRARVQAADRMLTRLRDIADKTSNAAAAELEPTAPNVRASGVTLCEKFLKMQTFSQASSHILNAISGLGLEKAVAVDQHVYADKEPSFAMWCSIVAPHCSVWVDVLVEADRKSSMLLFESLTGIPAESAKDALDTLGEVVNIVQGGIKTALQAEGHEVVTPVVPKPVPAASLPKLNEHMVDRVRVGISAGAMQFSVTLYLCSRPIVRKTIESLRAKDVTVESLPMPPGVDLKLLNRGVMLDDRAVNNLRDRFVGDSRRLALNVVEAPALVDLFRGA